MCRCFMTYNVHGLNITYHAPIEVGDNSITTTTATTTTENIHLDCPQYGYRLLGWKDYQFKTDVNSWPACSQHCQDRQECWHWVWYKKGHFCLTMTSYTSKYPSADNIAGDRDCEGNMVTPTHLEKVSIRKQYNKTRS